MTHHDLKLYKKAIEFVTEVYRKTLDFPNDEKFGLISQFRRAAVSIPTNIAEGSARKSKKELCHYLYIALGSISEIDSLIQISKNLNYLSLDNARILDSDMVELRKMTVALIKSINSPE